MVDLGPEPSIAKCIDSFEEYELLFLSDFSSAVIRTWSSSKPIGSFRVLIVEQKR